MKYIIFVLGLVHVTILFASATALAILLVKRISQRLWRLVTERSQARKPVRRLRKISAVPKTAEH